MSSLAANVRGEIFLRWQPDDGWLAEDERPNAQRLWKELSDVAGARGWRSTALLAGQLVEANLRSKLVGAGFKRLEVQGLRMFSQVIQRARKLGLLSAPARQTGARPPEPVIKLRNESSHFALWQPYTCEAEATWALALAALILDDLGLSAHKGAEPGFRSWLEVRVHELQPAASLSGTAAPAAPDVPRKMGFVAAPHGAKGKLLYSFGAIRSGLYAGWHPPTAGFSPAEAVAASALWHEVKLTAEHRAWKAMASLCGQMIEGYLKSKLVHAGKATRAGVEGKTLMLVIELCDSEGLFARPPTQTTTAADAVSSAEILRNWASHYAFWLPYTDELRATQALALAACVLESLYPEPSPTFVPLQQPAPPEWVRANWRSVAPGSLLSLVEKTGSLPPPLDRPTPEVLDHILRFGALSTVGRLFRWARHTCPPDELRGAVLRHFPNLLRKAHREGLRRLMDAVFQLDGVFRLDEDDEPAPTALVFGILLPIGAAALKHVFQFSTARIPLYLALARRSGDNLHSQGLRCTQRRCTGITCGSVRCQQLIPAFWEAFSPFKNQNPLNMANALIHMPHDVKVAFLTRIPTGFLQDRETRPVLEWLARNRARNGANLLASLQADILRLDKSARLPSFKQEVVAALVAAVGKDPVEELSMLPRRLYHLGLANDEGVKAVLTAVLKQTGSRDTTGNHTRRILWDTYRYVPALSIDAVRSAGTVLERDLVPAWDTACIAGILEVDQPSSCAKRWATLGWNDREFDAKLRLPNVDRWQKLLAVLAAFRRAAILQQPVPPNVADTARAILATLRTDEAPPASLALVAQLRHEVY